MLAPWANLRLAPRGARRSGRGSGLLCVGGDGPLVAVGVGDTGQAVAVELVGGLGDGGGAGGHRLGVDGVAVGDVEVDEAAGGRVLGRHGVGQGRRRRSQPRRGRCRPGAWAFGRVCEVGLVSASAHLAYASLSALMCRGVDQRYETVGDSLHVFWVGSAGWGQVALGRIYGAYAV